MAVNKWNLLSAEDRKMWIEKAVGLSYHDDASELTEKQKTQQIRKVKKQLISQVLLHINYDISITSIPGYIKLMYQLEIHACSNPSPLTKSMQLYFRNYMKYLYRL